jgi:membrane associated rhomboid family serine protease
MFISNLVVYFSVTIGYATVYPHTPRQKLKMNDELNLLSAQSWIYFTVLLNFYCFYYQDYYIERYPPHSLNDFNIWNMIISMFYHADTVHLFSNMIGLLIYSESLFISTRSSCWKHVATFLVLYFGCGILGSIVTHYFSLYYYQFLWNSRLSAAQNKLSCDSWWCENALNYLTKPLATAWTYSYYWKEYVALAVSRSVLRIGASGGVYGLIGARLMTGLFSPDHAPLSYFMIVWILMHVIVDLAGVPTSLDDLSQKLWKTGKYDKTEEQMIDHICHISSFICGLCMAILMQLVKSWKGRKSSRN